MLLAVGELKRKDAGDAKPQARRGFEQKDAKETKIGKNQDLNHGDTEAPRRLMGRRVEFRGPVSSLDRSPHAKRVEVLVDECDQLCRILGKSIATAKAARQTAARQSGQRLPITNNRYSMTNSQSGNPKI
jgi:hypothetical protein